MLETESRKRLHHQCQQHVTVFTGWTILKIKAEKGKPLASSLYDQTTGRLIRQHQNAKLIFGKSLQKRSKIEKGNTNTKFCIFNLVYSTVPNMRGVGINGRLENQKVWKCF